MRKCWDLRICVKVTHRVIDGSVRVRTVCHCVECVGTDVLYAERVWTQGCKAVTVNREEGCVCARAKHGHASEADNFGI